MIRATARQRGNLGDCGFTTAMSQEFRGSACRWILFIVISSPVQMAASHR